MMGLYVDEIVLDQRIALGPYVFTREKMLAYSRQFDPVGFHVDDAAGRAGPYGAITAAGLHTASAWMACFVRTSGAARAELERQGKTLPELGPSPGFKHLKWHKPVYAEDVVSYFATPQHTRLLRSSAGWGIVSGYNEGFNQRNELVFSFESAVLTASRPG